VQYLLSFDAMIFVFEEYNRGAIAVNSLNIFKMELLKRPREGPCIDNLINKTLRTTSPYGKAAIVVNTNLSNSGSDLLIMESYICIKAGADCLCYVILRDGMIISVHDHIPEWQQYVHATIEFNEVFPSMFTFITPVLLRREEHQFSIEQLICYQIEPRYQGNNCTIEFRTMQLEEKAMTDAITSIVKSHNAAVIEYYNNTDMTFVVWYGHSILNESKIMTDKQTRFNIGSYTFKSLNTNVDKMIRLDATNVISYHVSIKVNGFHHLLLDPHLFLCVNHSESTLRFEYSYTKPGHGLPMLFLEQDNLLRVRDMLYCFCYSIVCTFPAMEEHQSFHQFIKVDMPLTPFKNSPRDKESLHVFLFKYRS
jgi:hypothetical protein